MPIEESIARATGTAGTAVVFAGLTVLIALAGLSVVGIPFLTVMGLAAAGTVGDLGAHRDHPAARAAGLRRREGAAEEGPGRPPPRCGPSRRGRTA